MPRPTPPEPLTPTHDCREFDCGEPALNDWLRLRALANESRFSRTYVTCMEGRVVGFYCLSAGAVDRAVVPGRLRRNAPDRVPVTILGRLAVARGHAGQGIGADLLSDALARVAMASRSIGIAALLVHAKDDRSKAFYLHCAEFLEYPGDSRVLWLPLDTVVRGMGGPGQS